jgi:hypothetical protein
MFYDGDAASLSVVEFLSMVETFSAPDCVNNGCVAI